MGLLFSPFCCKGAKEVFGCLFMSLPFIEAAYGFLLIAVLSGDGIECFNAEGKSRMRYGITATA